MSFYRFLGKYNPKALTSIRYKKILGKSLNWNNPIDINEKINWLKIYSDTSSWTRLADKFAVREYIIQKGYEDILVDLYGVWDQADEIDWDILPNKFVLKMNNGSGDITICQDKNNLDKSSIINKYQKLFKQRFGYITAEPHYISMKPLLIAEELLNVSLQPIKTSSLIDYKIWCFDGKVECIWACYNRTKYTVEVGTYDLDWNYHPEFSIYTEHYIRAEQLLPRPQSLDRMIEIAAELSKGFPQVRIDLYEVNGKPYFGEMTFTSNRGIMDFYTQDYLNHLGSLIKI